MTRTTMSSSNTATLMDSSLGYHNVGYRRRIGHREEEADIILFGASFCLFVQRV